MDIFAEELDGVLSGRIPFTFHFQPVVDLKQGIATGYESLVRFGGSLKWSPDQWFSAANKLGKRLELETLVASKALEARTLIPRNCFLAVNAGPALLLSEQWKDMLSNISSLAGVVIEITEQDPIDDYAKIQQTMALIRAKGGRVAVDDVGSGYASLKHVMEVRPDFLKLDRAFIGGCHLDPARSALIETIGTIAGRLDAWIIAEGVETSEELAELIRLDVALAQGYHLGRPVPRMEQVSVEIQLAIAEAADARSGLGTISPAMEQCSIHRNSENARLHLDRFPDSFLAAVVDEWNRPAFLLERHPLLGMRTLGSPMKVQVESEIKEVLHRALARQLSLRFDPLVVINDRGAFQGVLRLDRLMSEALDKPAPEKRRALADRIPVARPVIFQAGAAD